MKEQNTAAFEFGTGSGTARLSFRSPDLQSLHYLQSLQSLLSLLSLQSPQAFTSASSGRLSSILLFFWGGGG